MNNSSVKDFACRATLRLHELKPIPDKGYWSPVGVASGCVVYQSGQKYILTVAHAISETNHNENRWGVCVSVENKFQKYNIVPFIYLKIGKIDTGEIKKGSPLDTCLKELRLLDFGYYKTYDVIPLYQEFDGCGNIILSEERPVFQGIHQPNLVDTYYFYGETRVEIDNLNMQLPFKPRFSACEYLEELGYMYKFELPTIITDPADYQGCSGAPIFNENHQLVSLVVSGEVNTPYLYGFNISALTSIIAIDT